MEGGFEPSDAELIVAVRAGDDSAFGALWQRHEGAALRLARQIARPSNAEDLVSEAFARVLRAMRDGGGPDGAFRPYLFSTLRRINIDLGRSYHQRMVLTGEDSDLESELVASAADTVMINAEQGAAWQAWQSLPESTRTLLWHLIIEEESPAQIAPLLGTTPNGVSSRAVRARERLRQAFLQQHAAEATEEDCRVNRQRLGEYVRDALSARDRAEVQAHLDGCDRCRAALFDIADVNQTLRVVIAPIVLGTTAAGGAYLAASGTGSSSSAAAVPGGSGSGAVSGGVAAASVVAGGHGLAIAVSVVAAALITAGIGVAATRSGSHRNPDLPLAGAISATGAPGSSAARPAPSGTQPGPTATVPSTVPPAPGGGHPARDETSAHAPSIATHPATTPSIGGSAPIRPAPPFPPASLPGTAASGVPAPVTSHVASSAPARDPRRTSALQFSSAGHVVITVPAGWRIDSLTAADGASCTVKPAEADCSLAPAAGSAATVTVTSEPSGSGGTGPQLVATFTATDGSVTVSTRSLA